MKDQRVPRGPVYLLCASVLLSSLPVRAHAPARPADSLQTTGHEIVGGIVAVSVAVGVGATIGIYYALHRPIKGCVTSGSNGLQITSEGSNQTYQLTGTTTAIKPGQVVSLKGRKKSAKGAPPTFDVDKVGKTYGSCAASPAQ